MLSTYRWKGTLIIVSPGNPRLFKFKFTWMAIAILALSCLISFCLLVSVGYTFPPLVTEREHVKLAKENQELRLRNLNAEFVASKTEEAIARMEKQSQRIVELVEAE